MRITNIPETEKRLDALEKTVADTIAGIRNFLGDMGGKLDALMQFKGELIGERSLCNDGAMPAIPMPAGKPERVIQILKQVDQSMKPKEILEYYQRLGWDAPKAGRAKLYEGISGSLSYLLNRKGILKNKKGYSITQMPREGRSHAQRILRRVSNDPCRA